MIKRFFNWLIKPPVLAFFGVLLLSLIFWFEAPLLALTARRHSSPPACAGSSSG